ncbi:HAMP domain-containing methyl-accepting chemotaxis protein [Rhizobium sp. 32-5/1]|uniref:methyl-accepting chemotaxis protein n=1 Tax=Rhizobium sp. 32-5/1 TaxID=3019602 RepID=UPI00240E7231|nr:HAMP domain-containing methyl-accepting chemotaxis protein [Rhizobium sp. 32-5/1]WEZ83278.1 HAMP domain-containing methyl-accepting chemotaxis protein [Rhizobium sp. 32-5/1]
MSLIDRSLQRLRIVTKVLLFVVPLVALIAGIGLVGYFTASTLNGHMTVTRETISSLSDFQALRSAVQRFTDNPTDETRQELAGRVGEQEAGVRSLSDLLPTDADRAEIASVLMLGDTMRSGSEKLWSIETERDAVATSLDSALTEMTKQGNMAYKQIDVLRKEAGEKESFAKALLFDAAAYQGLAERIKKFRLPVTMAVAPDAKLGAAQKFLPHLMKQIADAEAIASDKVRKQIAVVRTDAEKIAAIIASSDANDVKKTKLVPILSKFSKYEADFAKEAVKNSDTAAKRFVGMDSEISLLKSLIALMDETFKGLDATRLHISELHRNLTAESRAAVIADITAVRETATKLSETGGKNAALRDLLGKLTPSLEQIDSGTAQLIDVGARWQVAKAEVATLVADASQTLENFVSRAQEVGKQDSQRSADVSIIAMVAGTLLAIIGGLMLIETLRGPLKRVTETMTRLANGDLEVPIEGRNRGDEIGDMVRSVAVFRDHAVENVRLEREAEVARTLSAEEEARRNRERARIEAEQMQALTALSDVLAKLADGNLEEGMAENLSADYVVMARTYNNAVEALRATLIDVRIVTDEITGGTSNLAASADDLARRTEQQAAALEQSSRALGQLTEIVRSTAESARKTTVSVDETHSYARHSGQVVSKAIDAMAAINKSSDKISTIISVIDEIAFQTNLLALNAGVEAARAGEAGRGFAVVAQEVRELAQRCAGAAREIKGLISESSAQVRSGVELVQETGTALTVINDHISTIHQLVSNIESAAADQYRGLNEVNQAVRQVELITQQNAAMVEENTAEIHGLRRQVDILNEKIERFKTGTSRSTQGYGSGNSYGRSYAA